MRSGVVAGALVLLGLLWAGVAAQVHREPSPGTGIVTVAVENTPSVKATQAGDWKVALSEAADVRVTNTPSVIMSPPAFLKRATRYAVVWPNGDQELIVVDEIRPDGWVRVKRTEGARWLNVAAARSLEERR